MATAEIIRPLDRHKEGHIEAMWKRSHDHNQGKALRFLCLSHSNGGFFYVCH